MNGYMTVWEVEKLLGNAANKSGRVVANAANRTLPTGAKVIKQETANEYNVRQKDVEETLRRIKANWSDPTAILDSPEDMAICITSEKEMYQS